MLSLFKKNQHKRYLLNAFSNCFNALKDGLGNVPVRMQSSHEITGSVLGACRGYAIAHNINESHFNLLVDAVFEDIFRRESIVVQTKAEQWLSTENEIFMLAYYHAKSRTSNHKTVELAWLSDYAKKYFKTKRPMMPCL
jgi:hypothetical protein